MPFKGEDITTPQQVEQERRLMQVGITRARQTPALSVLRRGKRGHEVH